MEAKDQAVPRLRAKELAALYLELANRRLPVSCPASSDAASLAVLFNLV